MSKWYDVRFADNDIDRGYRNHVQADSENEAREIVLRRRRWDNQDCKVNYTRDILTIREITFADTMTPGINLYPGDVAARDTF